LDRITAIEPAGQEEVFDVEIARTENFIANGVVSHNTRWSLQDLTGKLINFAAKNPESEPWEVIELPAILNEKSLWPEQWPLESLLQKKAGMDPRYWNAQYMQQPTADAAAVIKREYWNIWEADKPPKCEWVIQTWDTAHEAKTTADYSACTTWGIWSNEEDNGNMHIILLDAFKDRLEFPELKRVVFKHWKEWEPDALLVEKKAAGAPLIQELRSMGVSVAEYTPSRGNDKISRINAVSDMFFSGRVWAPDTRWAREVIEEVASFPAGEHDDYVDCTSMALLRFRQGGLIRLDTDEKDEMPQWRARRAAYY
jgi:hypothetical protein